MTKRVINAKSQLDPLLKDKDKFLIGFGTKSLTTEGIHYKDLTELIKGNINEKEVSKKEIKTYVCLSLSLPFPR
ncbi:hypothetical protein BDE36_2059 [Arcticibacter tournemirensis]|uniref:Uncharacterized protein n=1 Tax=Arcticibacter tournemirensis TaxID=699437 RepID=A0A5M9HIX2_9SPHI|nr:hypothetical protein [Arcticibacter tournemirensis]KAA8485391.1 hypothetical protein F1649_04550 [Arcticibacter tournemirensis]TQM50317.1 hypothetical protein BDE36_2059 [Arcticibacter tournemirensis]